MNHTCALITLAAISCLSAWTVFGSDAASGKADVLYASDFGKETNGWTVVSGDFQVDGGACRIQAITEETKLSRSIIGDKSWRDYSVESRIKLETSLRDNSDYGLMARYQDPQNYYMFLYKIEPKKIVIERKLNGKLEDIAEAHVELEAGTWHVIKGTLSGKNLKVEVDGKLLAEVSDENFSDGGAGMLAYWDDVKFEYVNVQRVDRSE